MAAAITWKQSVSITRAPNSFMSPPPRYSYYRPATRARLRLSIKIRIQKYYEK